MDYIRSRRTYSRVIRIDAEVWCWLESQSEGLGDTPNQVLRRFMLQWARENGK